MSIPSPLQQYHFHIILIWWHSPIKFKWEELVQLYLGIIRMGYNLKMCTIKNKLNSIQFYQIWHNIQFNLPWYIIQQWRLTLQQDGQWYSLTGPPIMGLPIIFFRFSLNFIHIYFVHHWNIRHRHALLSMYIVYMYCTMPCSCWKCGQYQLVSLN
jgi:hypothetical protein